MARYKDENVVISDCRFPNEIEAIRELGGRIVQIERGESTAWWHHAVAACNGDVGATGIMKSTYAHIHVSEWAWANTKPDELIWNTGTLDQLYGMVKLLDNKYEF